MMDKSIDSIFATVIIFHPDIDKLKSDILSFIQEVDHVVIFRNSDEALDLNGCGIPGDKLTFLGNGDNIGTAGALNRSVEWGKSHGYEYMMAMDQDSEWTDVRSYLSTISQISDEKKVIFAPIIDNHPNCNTNNEVITSGSVYRLSIFDKIGMFDENLFVDCVDHEMCYRARQYGYEICLVPAGKFIHDLGYRSRIGKTKYIADNYSAQRLFWITRNSFWIYKKYHKIKIADAYHPGVILKRTVNRTKKIIIGETDKASKIKALAKGLRQGILYRLP